MKKCVLVMAIMYVTTSNATTCSVSQVEWEYKVTSENTGTQITQGKKVWDWANGTIELSNGYPYDGGGVYFAQTYGAVLLDSLPGFSVRTLLRANGDPDIGGYNPGHNTGYWGTFYGSGTNWSRGIILNFTMADEDPKVTFEGNCGDWVPGINMTTRTSKRNDIRQIYDSIFRFKTVPLTSKISVGMNPRVINLECITGQDCITQSNLVITNPTAWSGKMYVTYPTVEGVSYNYYGNWVSQMVGVHAIEANTSSNFTQQIKLFSKKTGEKIFSIPVLVELV